MANTFGEVVKALRKKSGLTLEAVARRIGSHKGYVSGIENEKVNPPAAGITRKIARVYARTLEESGIKATEEDFVELAWVWKSPALVRDRLVERVTWNPLLSMKISVVPGRPPVPARPARTNLAPRPISEPPPVAEAATL